MILKQPEFNCLLDRIEKKRVFISNGKEKIADVLEGIPVDALPLIFVTERNHLAQEEMPYDREEQFYSKEKMLWAQLVNIEACAGREFNSPLCLRPDFGTIFIPSLLGLEYKVFKDTYPCLTNHLTKDEIRSFQMPELRKSEMMQRAIEYIQYFKQNIPDWIHVYLPDTQGPFDIAHLIFGNNIFYEIHDDPEFVHTLMRISTDLYKDTTIILKEVIGESLNSCYHGNAKFRGIFMRIGGIRIAADSATLISPQHINEFVIPYDREVLQYFGGGFVHFCGKNEHLLDAYICINEVRAVNLGQPEMYDSTSIMSKFLRSGKVYFGRWPKNSNENYEQYIYRMIKASDGGKKGLLLQFDEDMLKGDELIGIYKCWTNKIAASQVYYEC